MTQTLMEAVAVGAGLPETTADRVKREALFRALDAVAQVARPDQLRAVAYLRVSTEDQKKGYGVSYTGKRVVRYIAKKDWALVGIFADEGYSGTLDHTKRPDLKRLMELARQEPRPFDVVAVQEARAIGREGEAFWPWVWELKKLGIFVAVAKRDYDNTTDEGRSKMRKDADQAEDERILIRDRTQGGIQDKAEVMAADGAYLGGNVPYGYRIENKGVTGESCLVPDDCDCPGECARLHEADGVRFAVARFAATLNFEGTGSEMNRAGYRRKNGALWDYGSVYNLLHSRATVDAVTVHRGSKDVVLGPEGKPLYGESIEIKLKPILTQQELSILSEAKAKRPPRRTPKTFTYTLAGRIKSPCGFVYVARGMSRQGDKHGRSPFKGLQCQGNKSNIPKAKRCKCPIIRAEPVERESWRLVKEFLSNPEELERLATEAIQAQRQTGADFDAQLAELNKRAAELEESIDLMLMAATQQATARRLSRTEAEKYIAKMTAEPNAELAGLQKQREEIGRWKENAANADSVAKHLRTLAERAKGRLEGTTLDEQAELFNLLQAEVEIVGEAPSRPLGRPCQAVAFFTERGLTVPYLTDEAWSKVADIVPVLSRQFPPRDILAGFLEKARTGLAWTALDVGVPHTTLMNHWIRWGVTGGLEAVMERLAGMPGTPPPDHDAVTVRVRCTILPEVLLMDSDPDGNEASSLSVGSNGGSKAPFTFSVLLAA